MTDRVDVERLVSIRAHDLAVGRFSDEALAALNGAEEEIRATIRWLEQLESRRMDDLADAEARLDDAISELRACLEDDDWDCGYLRDEVAECRSEVSRCRSELADVRRWQGRVQVEVRRYLSQAADFRSLLFERAPQARGLLQRFGDAVAQVERIGLHPGGAVGGAMSVEQGVAEASTAPPRSELDPPMVEEGGAEADPRAYAACRDRPFPIARLGFDDLHVKGPEDFKKVSYQDMVEGFRKLTSLVRPAVEAGMTRDEFRDLDAKQRLSMVDGYLRIYDAFYGREPIRVVWDGHRWAADNGHHRLYVAMKLGIRDVPAEICMQGAAWSAVDGGATLPGEGS